MRTIVQITIPNEPFNTLVRNGTAAKTLQKILESNKPQAAYFTEQEGHRGAILVIDLKEPSSIPTIAEPWYLALNADVKFRVAMTPEDLARSGIDQMAKAW